MWVAMEKNDVFHLCACAGGCSRCGSVFELVPPFEQSSNKLPRDRYLNSYSNTHFQHYIIVATSLQFARLPIHTVKNQHLYIGKVSSLPHLNCAVDSLLRRSLPSAQHPDCVRSRLTAAKLFLLLRHYHLFLLFIMSPVLRF